MKRVLLAGATLLALTAAQPTLAADAPVYKGPRPVAAALFNWSGCYAGVHAGGGWGRSSLFYVPAGGVDFGSYNIDGWLAGGQLGCNYQMGALVLGVEGDLAWARIGGSVIDPGVPAVTGHIRSNWLGSVTGRAGIAMDRALIYVKGGGAWMHADHWLNQTPGAGDYATGSATHSGWTAGAGLEWAFAANWSAKLEFNYYDFGTSTVNLACPVGCATNPAPIIVHPIIHTVTLGLNWRF